MDNTSSRLQMQKTWAAYECQKLFNRHCAMDSAGMRRQSLESQWARRDDTCLGQNDGFWIGWDSVYNAYVKCREASLNKAAELTGRAVGAGSMTIHASTTPIVEAADDLKTAKGFFYSPGYVTNVEERGRLRARWVMERYAVDFIREESGWKIWHMFIGVDYVLDVGQRLYQSSPVPEYNHDHLPLLDGNGMAEFIPPYDLKVPGLYSSALGWCGYPPEPEPYDIFENTFSYGFEPFAGSKRFSDPDSFLASSEQRFNFNSEVK